MLRMIRRNKGKRSVRIGLILMTAVLAIGLVGSFAIWSLPSKPSPSKGNSGESSVDYQQLEEIIEAQRQVLAENPEDIEALVKLGNGLYDLGVSKLVDGQDVEQADEHLTEALTTYEKVLELKSEDDFDLEMLAATAAFYTGNNEQAESHFVKALEINPESLEAMINYGQFLLYGKGDIAGAKERWQQALELAPNEAAKESIKELISQAEQIEELQQQAEQQAKQEEQDKKDETAE